MNVALIAEKKTPDIEALIKAFNSKKIDSEFVEIGSIGVLVEKNSSILFHEGKSFSEYDSVFLSLPVEFTVFAEPFISELVDSGIYCNLKPNSYYLLSNKPFLYVSLNSKKVNISKTDIIADKETIDASLKTFSYPLIVKTFSGLKKTNSVLIESERSLKSFIRSISVNIDAITIQEYLEGDVDQSLVIGDDVFTIKRKWVEKELSHSKKPLTTKLSDNDREMAIKAAKVSGMDIGVVKMINGKVIGVRNKIDFAMFNDASSQNMYEKVVAHYEEKMRGK